MNISPTSIKTIKIFDSIKDSESSKYSYKNNVKELNSLKKESASLKNKLLLAVLGRNVFFVLKCILGVVFILSALLLLLSFAKSNGYTVFKTGFIAYLLSAIDIKNYLFLSIVFGVAFYLVSLATKSLKSCAKSINRKIENHMSRKQRLEEEVKIAKNKLNISEINNTLTDYQEKGNNFFDEWKKNNKEDDLYSAAQYGHPYAVMIVLLDMISAELSVASIYAGMYIASRSKREKVVKILSYCSFFYLTNYNADCFSKHKIKIPYKNDFDTVGESASFINDLINIKNADNHSFIDTELFSKNANRKAKESRNCLIPELYSFADSISVPDVHLTTSDMQEIIHRVDGTGTNKTDDYILMPVIPSGEVDLSGSSPIDWE